VADLDRVKERIVFSFAAIHVDLNLLTATRFAA